MTVLELANEHVPLDLARIVDDYAINKDWRPAMDNVVATMNSRGVAAANMMEPCVGGTSFRTGINTNSTVNARDCVVTHISAMRLTGLTSRLRW